MRCEVMGSGTAAKWSVWEKAQIYARVLSAMAAGFVLASCGTHIDLDVPVEVLSPLCNQEIAADRSVEVDCSNPEAVPAIATTGVAGTDQNCERVVQTDEYGLQEVVEVCADAPAVDNSGAKLPEAESTVGPMSEDETEPKLEDDEVSASSNPYRYERNPSMEEYVGGVEAFDLTVSVRDRFILLAECPGAADDLSSPGIADRGADGLRAVPDPDVLAQFELAFEAMAEADALCGPSLDVAWQEAYIRALGELDKATALVDAGVAVPVRSPSVADVSAESTILTTYAMAIYERFFWAMRGYGPRVSSDFWIVSEQLAIVDGARRYSAEFGQTEVALFGASVAASGVDVGAVSKATGRDVANFALSASGVDYADDWTKTLVQLGLRPKSAIQLLTTHDLISRCPSLDTAPRRTDKIMAQAFQGAAAFRSYDPFDLSLNPGIRSDASPLRSQAAYEFAQLPADFGRVDPRSDRFWEPGSADFAPFAARFREEYENEVCESWWPYLSQLVDLWRNEGIEQVGFVLMPRPEQLNEMIDGAEQLHEEAAAQLEAFAVENDVDFADRSHELEVSDFLDVGGHYNDSGRARFSELLIAVLAEWKW